jgi:hypothetical protein
MNGLQSYAIREISACAYATLDRTAFESFGLPTVRIPTSTDRRSESMKNLHHALIAGCLACAASGAFAQDAMKKDMPMKDMTMADCKAMMEKEKKETTKQEDAVMMKKREQCNAMMKKDGMKDPMKK